MFTAGSLFRKTVPKQGSISGMPYFSLEHSPWRLFCSLPWTETNGRLRTCWNSLLALIKSHSLKASKSCPLQPGSAKPRCTWNHWAPCPWWLKERLLGNCCRNPGSRRLQLSRSQSWLQFCPRSSAPTGGTGQH